MTDALFQRAAGSILGLLGKDALFRGATRTKVNIERDVDFTGYDDTAAYKGDLTVRRDVATVSAALNPRGGDTFQFGTFDAAGVFTPSTTDPAVYRLEKKVENNGFNPRYVVIKLP